MTVGNWTCSIGYPEGAVALPVTDDSDPRPWANDQAREMLGPDAAPEQVDLLTRELVSCTLDCRTREPTFAFAFYPDPAISVLAMLEVHDYRPDNVNRTLTLDWLEKTFAARMRKTIGEIEVTRGELPAGPMVRIRQQLESPGPGDDSGRGMVVERVTYGIRPPQIEEAIVIHAWWTALALGEELLEMTGEVAETLEINLGG